MNWLFVWSLNKKRNDFFQSSHTLQYLSFIFLSRCIVVQLFYSLRVCTYIKRYKLYIWYKWREKSISLYCSWLCYFLKKMRELLGLVWILFFFIILYFFALFGGWWWLPLPPSLHCTRPFMLKVKGREKLYI